MEELPLNEVLSLRSLQEEIIDNRATFMEYYRKILKRTYTAQLNQLVRTEFDRTEVELNIPQLPKSSSEPDDYKPMFQLDKMVELYDATLEGLSLL